MSNKPDISRLVELVILLTAVLVPFFVLANEVDSDEFIKAGTGIFLTTATGIVFAAYRLWKGKSVFKSLTDTWRPEDN